MPIKIDMPWNGLVDQKVSDTSGNQWSVANLIAAVESQGLPVMEVPLEHLCIDKNLDGMRLRLFVAHMMLADQADLEHPIILDEDGAIFDGVHRVAKALAEKQETIKAVRFVRDPAPFIFGNNQT